VGEIDKTRHDFLVTLCLFNLKCTNRIQVIHKDIVVIIANVQDNNNRNRKSFPSLGRISFKASNPPYEVPITMALYLTKSSFYRFFASHQ